MNPEGSAPPPPPAEVKAPAPEATKPAVENPASGPQSAEQPQAADKLSDGSSLNDIADKFDKGEVDLDAEFKKFAENGEPTPNAEAPAQTPDASTNPAVENPSPPVPEQPDAQTTPDAPNDKHDIDSQQARLDDMMNKTPEELSKLAAEGNIHAKKALGDMEKQVSSGAEDLLKQQSETPMEPPLKPDGTRMTNDEWMTLNADQRYKAIHGVDRPGSQAANEGAQQTPPVPSAEQVKQDWKDWEGQAQYKEPSAAERANGAQVEAKNDTAPPPIENKNTESANEGTQQNAENQVDAEKTPAEQAVESRKQGMELVEKLNDVGITAENPHYQEVKDLLATNPELADNLDTFAKAFGAIQGTSPEAASAAATAAATKIEEQANEADKSGDKAKSKLMKALMILLKAIAIAVAIPAGAALGAGAAVGAIANGSSK